MDKCSFYNKVNEAIEKAPHLFALETDSKANNEMIKGIESYYDVKLPEAYEDFVSQYGGGYFGCIVVYSCDNNGMFYIKDRVSKKEVIEKAFLPVVDFETGDFLGFEIIGGKMDYLLDIIIPKKEIETVKLHEKLFEWGEGVYSYNPPQYVSDSDIIFEQVEDVQYFSKIIGEELTNDIIVLHLKSDLLFDLEYAVNNHESILEENVLLIFLNKLIELSQFYILMVREDESVKEYYKIVKKEEINIRLFESLSWSSPKDVLLFKKK